MPSQSDICPPMFHALPCPDRSFVSKATNMVPSPPWSRSAAMARRPLLRAALLSSAWGSPHETSWHACRSAFLSSWSDLLPKNSHCHRVLHPAPCVRALVSRSKTSRACGLADSMNSNWSREPACVAPARVRVRCAVHICRRSWPNALDPLPSSSPLAQHRAKSRWPKPQPTHTPMSFATHPCTTNTLRWVRRWIASADGGGRGTTATTRSSIGRFAKQCHWAT